MSSPLTSLRLLSKLDHLLGIPHTDYQLLDSVRLASVCAEALIPLLHQG